MSKLSAERNKDLDDIAGILIIASGSAYHKIYPDPRMLLIGWITILVVYILGFFPGKVFKLGGSKEPKSFMLDWTSDIRYGLFNIRECPHNNVHSHLKNIKQPVLFISFDKDSFVPHESASHFASLFPEKQVKHIKVDPQDHEELKHLNRHALHFKWARGEMVLPLIENWIRGTIQTSAHGKQ
jgi:predicted alpha/beta hydrolase